MSFAAVKWARSQNEPTNAQMLVLLDLAMYHDETRGAWPHLDTIAAGTNLSVGQVRRAIAWLRQHGYLTSEQRGRGKSAVYRLDLSFYDSPRDVPEPASKLARNSPQSSADTARADQPTLITVEEHMKTDISRNDVNVVAARIQRDWWRFVKAQTGRHPIIAATDKASVLAFKGIIVTFLQAGVSEHEVKVAVRAMWEAGATFTRQRLGAEIDRRTKSTSRPNVGTLAKVRFDDAGNVIG